jgi:hypothetical protein
MACIQYHILLVRELNIDVPDLDIPSNLISAVENYRKFDKNLLIDNS